MPDSTTNTDRPAVYAIVPAAGQSRRMGAAKQLLRVGGRPMLRAVVEVLAQSRVRNVMVVTRREIDNALNLARDDRVFVSWNEDASSEMIDSVRIGLRAWQARVALTVNDGVLVCPGDLSRLTTEDVDACIRAWREEPSQIVIAAHGGRRGHPLIFPASLASFVESAACDGGLSAMARHFAARVAEVERPTTSVLHDVDTPGDLGRTSGAFI